MFLGWILPRLDWDRLDRDRQGEVRRAWLAAARSINIVQAFLRRGQRVGWRLTLGHGFKACPTEWGRQLRLFQGAPRPGSRSWREWVQVDQRPVVAKAIQVVGFGQAELVLDIVCI